jgi:hypothetical protein
MRIDKLIVVAAALVAMPTIAAMGQQAYVYPMKGQTPQQQNQDQGECHGWAVQQSGHNPYAGSAAQPTGGVVRGAAGGAAIGAVAGPSGAMPGRVRPPVPQRVRSLAGSDSTGSAGSRRVNPRRCRTPTRVPLPPAWKRAAIR